MGKKRLIITALLASLVFVFQVSNYAVAEPKSNQIIDQLIRMVSVKLVKL